jgi:hypothetical protein
MKFIEQNFHFFILNQTLYGRDSKFQNSEYEVHQIGPKDSESQNFWFPGIERAAVGVV